MRAAVVTAPHAKWQLKDIPQPEPAADQVLIKIHASGLCYTDIHQTEGSLPIKFPAVLGHEPVGEIVSIGEAVKTRKIGDRVGVPWMQSTCGRCEWCLRGKRLFCPDALGTSQHLHGGHAEFMLAFADATMLIPDGLSYEQAAPIFCAGYTVWGGLRIADPKPHERVAVLGIGGLGHLAIQYANAAGFETIAVSRSRDKDKMIRQLGAHEIVSDGQGLQKAGGADVILSTANSYAPIVDCLQALRPDGRVIVMGVSNTNEPLQIDPMQLLFKRARIIGSIQNGVEYLYEALDYAAKGKVKVMAETFPLSDIERAYEKVASGSVRFRAVITN